MAGEYARLLATGGPVLADGAVNTRVDHGTPIDLHPIVKSAGALVDPAAARVVRAIYASYVGVARGFGLPIVLTTATSRTDPDRLRAAGFPVGGADDLNLRFVELLTGLRDEADDVTVLVAGAVGAANDAYRPEQALDVDAAEEHHSRQARLLAGTGCDLVMAAPFPSVAEATGAARALAGLGLAYTVAFVLDRQGRVLDGTPLAEAVRRLDAAVDPPPVNYLIQCVHPRVAAVGLAALAADDPALLARVSGYKGNSADLSTDALDASERLHGDEPEPWGEAVAGLREQFGTQLLGGCCGTDERHLLSLAVRLCRDAPGS